uniref:Uncharacterized protein n=1 Tax=Biomphalaria glabrata TaxID=6526 RepID=A0A2C9KSS3_BIOGL
MTITFSSQSKTQTKLQEEFIKRKCLLLYCVQMEILLKSQRLEDVDQQTLKLRSDQPKLSVEKYITVTQSFLNLPVEEVRQFLEDLQSPSSRRVSDINSLMSQRDYKQFYVLVQQFKR